MRKLLCLTMAMFLAACQAETGQETPKEDSKPQNIGELLEKVSVDDKLIQEKCDALKPQEDETDEAFQSRQKECRYSHIGGGREHLENWGSPTGVTPALGQRFSRLALDCVQKEFPNKIAHVMDSENDTGVPSDFYPAFYGCFDWHSSVHGHWMLVRLLRTTPGEAEWKTEARTKLGQNLTPENIAGEVAYLTTPGRASFERPYGLAWLLQLTTELRQWDDPQAKEWLAALEPLEAATADKIESWLPNLAYPIHLGTHNQSAFAFGLMLDWAREAGDSELEQMLIDKSMAFHAEQVDCPIEYEPSGEDFLSACLMTADLMRRILPQDEFSDWLTAFLPNIPTDGSGDWLEPGVVKDASDGKLVHLDGVNLSRAWNLRNLAFGLTVDDPRRAALLASAQLHSETGLAAVSDEHYSGSHWLASYAVYLISDRGITE